VPDAGSPLVTPHGPGVFVGVGVGDKHPQPMMPGLPDTVNVWQFSPAGQLPPQIGGDPLNPHGGTVGVGVGDKHPQPSRLGLPDTVNVWQFSPAGQLPPQKAPLNPHGGTGVEVSVAGGVIVGVGVDSQGNTELPVCFRKFFRS
jgi:hypothetical protein